MAHSRHRHKHHTHQQHAKTHSTERKKSATGFMIPLIGAFGAAIALVTAGTNWLWVIAGIIIGCIAGYLLGKQIDKTAGK